MPTIECMHERMQPEHDYCPDCGETQTAESRAIRTLRARAERAEAERDVLRAAVEEIEERTRPNGDMADLDVNLVARAALGER